MQRTALAAIAVLAALSAPVAHAMGSFESNPKPTLSEAKRLVDRGAYAEAVPKLRAIVDEEPRNADALNLLGFSYRKLKDYPDARRSYDAALAIDPNHKGALEYLGEYYVETGDVAAARTLLARLEALCPSGCEEREDLQKSIAAAGSR